MKTIPFNYDKYKSTIPRPKVFTKGGIEVLDFQYHHDRELWKIWGRLITGPSDYSSKIGEDIGLEGWTAKGKFTIDRCSEKMKEYNKDGNYDLVMEMPASEQGKVVYTPGLRFKIYNVYHDPARNTIFLDGGFLTPGEAMENKDTHSHTYLGMFSLQDNPQFNQILLNNNLATIQKSDD